MLTTTEKEYREALYELSLLVSKERPDDVCRGCSCLSCIDKNGGMSCDYGYKIKLFNDLIHEAFNNPPLKVSEIEDKDWVWDDKNQEWIDILACRNNLVMHGRVSTDNWLTTEYEDNRFFERRPYHGNK